MKKQPSLIIRKTFFCTRCSSGLQASEFMLPTFNSFSERALYCIVIQLTRCTFRTLGVIVNVPPLLPTVGLSPCVAEPPSRLFCSPSPTVPSVRSSSFGSRITAYPTPRLFPFCMQLTVTSCYARFSFAQNERGSHTRLCRPPASDSVTSDQDTKPPTLSLSTCWRCLY